MNDFGRSECRGFREVFISKARDDGAGVRGAALTDDLEGGLV